MSILQPTHNPRLNEPVGFLLLLLAIALGLSLVSYHPLDPSWNTATGAEKAKNFLGLPGAYASDWALQWFGLPAFLAPFFLVVLGWLWVRSASVETPVAKLTGAILLLLVACAGISFRPQPELWQETVSVGGVAGALMAGTLELYLNKAGAVLVLVSAAVVAFYLLTSFTLQTAREWSTSAGGMFEHWTSGLRQLREKARERRRQRAEQRRSETKQAVRRVIEQQPEPASETAGQNGAGEAPPIVPYEEVRPVTAARDPVPVVEPYFDEEEEEEPGELPEWEERPQVETNGSERKSYRIPPTALLAPPSERSPYDPDELHETARQICSKFEEFGVRGTVAQINPGPVVTTFEFRPDPGIKYSKIVNLSEDLCLGLECESILVERIPGKSTVGIEVPNRKREIISLREIIESEEFQNNNSPISIALGKDISGRIRVTDLSSLPHLLIAGSTGSGKSVLINSIIMSILLKAQPEQVRFILVDPKTVELGLYGDIPHLLTPVVTDMKLASNALKNVTREMEYRLKLLAEHGVRNIEQFNAKAAKTNGAGGEDDEDGFLEPLPYIVVVIDELADLMMLEGRQIEESITRLAQMARAVGIHLILATQRPSVDVITGLIKANIPARISFRLATRVDSRTILDSMGAESLLGRGDMLFLPPGTARMKRVHGAFVTEEEIHAVVTAWKQQGEPDYEHAFLAPPAGEGDDGGDGEDEDFDDPAYREAVDIVMQMGKASTSTLQRRLRLGYGRAARILDAMEREGIIGPPDGSRPREVLRRPEWMV